MPRPSQLLAFARRAEKPAAFVQSDKDRAIAVARQVLRYEKAGITITPSETLVLAREFMRALNMREVGDDPGDETGERR